MTLVEKRCDDAPVSSGSEAPCSVVTYTCDDTSLLHELLEEIPSWTKQPDEILIVDGSSRQAFTVPPHCALPVRLIRDTSHQGFCVRKSCGIREASHEYVLSLDCDSRLSSNFLAVCCTRLADDPGIGLISGATRGDGGADAVSRYLRVFGDSCRLGISGDVDCIPGHAFALRRSVWNAVNGLGGQAPHVCEGGGALCASLRSAGYRLHVEGSIAVRQVRKLSRQAYCLRLWNWLQKEILSRMQMESPLAPQLANLFMPPLVSRSLTILESNDICLFYIELFCLLSHCANTLKTLAQTHPGGVAEEECAEVMLAAFDKALRAYPKLRCLIKEDLIRMGHEGVVRGAAAFQHRAALFAVWESLTALLDVWEKQGVLVCLDSFCVPRLMQEGEDRDFSPYAALLAGR